MPRHILAFDFGTRKIGVAAVDLDAANIVASCNELPTISAREGIPDWQEMTELIDAWKPSGAIVGLPLDGEGNDMEITRRARKFGNRIKGRFTIPVTFIDERLSTREAKQEAHERGRSQHYKSAPVDSIAARLILESWLSNSEEG